MPEPALHVVIRTPSEVVLEEDMASLRVPTHTGQVGLRPRSEPTVLAVEPGLIVGRHGASHCFAGTAGGMLRCDGASVTLLTPLAVVGAELASVSEHLDRALAQPSTEMEVRRTLGRIEARILQELREGDGQRGPAQNP